MAKTPPAGQKAKKKTKNYANKNKKKTKKLVSNTNDAVSTLKRKSKSRTLIESSDDSVNIVNELCSDIWYQYSDKLAMHIRDDINCGSKSAEIDGESQRAAMLFKKQENLFNARNTKDKDAKWLTTMMRNGTMSDRVSASTLAVQQNPIFSIKILLSLVSMAMKNNQREAQLAITALKDLFINNLMPSDRKLLYFVQQPVSHPHVSAKNLILWHYEDQIKTIFAKFVDALEKASGNKLKFFKIFAMNATKELLSAMPEQEVRLLAVLVNKVGDPERGVAAKAGFLLTRLLEEHPRMKGVVVAEVTQMLYRPNIGNRSKYYGVVFLNQIALRQGDATLARKLVDLYFTLFEQTVKDLSGKKQNSSMATRFLSALLTGVNRTCPYVSAGSAEDGDTSVASMLDDRVDTLFKLIHVGTFMTSTQALALLFQFTDVGNKSFVDRLYQALYKKIVSAEFRNARKPTTLLNVVFRAMKRDQQPRRVMAFARRLLQTAAQSAVPLCASLLYLVHAALSARADVGKHLLSSECVAEVVGSCANTGTQDTISSQLSEAQLSEANPSAVADEREEEDGDGGEDDADSGEDDGDGDDDDACEGGKDESDKDKDAKHHEDNADNNENGRTTSTLAHKKHPPWYDIATRNPKYAVPTTTRLWETPLLLSHYHPSVRRFAESLQQAKRATGRKRAETVEISPPEYQGDPMRDFTLMSFLDRFSYRNPKQQKESAKAAMQPKQHRSQRAEQEPVNSKTFLMQNPKHVAADEQFFYKFFLEKAKREARAEAKLGKSKKKKQSASDMLDREGDMGDALVDDSDGEEHFATMLAEKMMADHTRSTGGIDFDPDDDFNPFSEDEDEAIDDGDEDEGDRSEMAAGDTGDVTDSVFATAEEFGIMLENPDKNAPDYEETRNLQQQFKRKYISSLKKNKKSRTSRKNSGKRRK